MSTTNATTQRPSPSSSTTTQLHAQREQTAQREQAAQRGQTAQRGQAAQRQAAQRGHGAQSPASPASGRFAEVLARGTSPDGKHGSAAGALGAHLLGGAATSHSAAIAARHAPLPRAGDDAPTQKPDATRAGLEDGDRSLLVAFIPPPSVLSAPLAATPLTAPTASSAPARAEAAALAERLVRSMRVGKVGRDGHEVRLRLDVGARGDVEVRLRHVDGTLSATLVTDAASYVDAERLAVSLRRELAERGLVCEDVEVALAP